MQCVPLVHVAPRLEAMPFRELFLKFKQLMWENKYCRVVVYEGLGVATLWTGNPVQAGEPVKRGATTTEGYANLRKQQEKQALRSTCNLTRVGP